MKITTGSWEACETKNKTRKTRMENMDVLFKVRVLVHEGRTSALNLSILCAPD